MHKLLIANRGEIALRIMRTAQRMDIPTVAVYTASDALAPHVSFASEAVELVGTAAESKSEAQLYSSIPLILEVCRVTGTTMLHPGYGFLSENADFARAVVDAGIIWLGPNPDVIRSMGLKHIARGIAEEAGVPCVPGSDGLVDDLSVARDVARQVGYPIMLKASAGGGGMGMVICADENALASAFEGVQKRAEALFSHAGVFLERYFPASRHIEVQVFGDGHGSVVCLGERECSVQRRHQKIIEEAPSPFFAVHPELRVKMYEAATKLGQKVNYTSAGTVEFLVDDETASFYFLEMNTRIQVEHPVTEMLYPNLDLVELMIKQGLGELRIQQDMFDANRVDAHAIEVRVYAENPAVQFQPSPGILQYVSFPSAEKYPWLRVDTWISTGTRITPFFDPLLAKIIVSGATRDDALQRLLVVLNETNVRGPPNNIEYLKAVIQDPVFREGRALTTFLSSFEWSPRAVTVLSAPVEMTVQDYPGRTTRMGIPRSGPMDSMAFRAANVLVGNSDGMEGLEVIVLPGVPALLKFHTAAVVAITGRRVQVTIEEVDESGGQPADMWARIIVPASGQLHLLLDSDSHSRSEGGLRTYIAIRGGFPSIPRYLDSKSTSMGLGGYQGRSLVAGDELALADYCAPIDADTTPLVFPTALIPKYDWDTVMIHVLAGPHDDPGTYVTAAGIEAFYGTHWRVSPASNRLGVRLESPSPGKTIEWARASGGAGGSHASNILDSGYALGSVNINGDTPVVLTNEGPDMGGYVCLCTVVSGEMWKVGQVAPGGSVRFKRVSWEEALRIGKKGEEWLDCVKAFGRGVRAKDAEFWWVDGEVEEDKGSPILFEIPATDETPAMVVRQAGDSAILVELGEMELDFSIRARIHALETALKDKKIRGLDALCPCIRSTMLHYTPAILSQASLVDVLRSLPVPTSASLANTTFPGRRITFPIVLDDHWCRDAVARYMSTTRDSAVYLPSNVEYLTRNNGCRDAEEVLSKLVQSDWLVFGVGFYLACPFLVPIDPRCRIVAQKMNPSRTYTPRGAVGLAGVVAAIYPIVSPGGYMMFGRTLPAWQEWGRGQGGDFAPDRPWLLRPFDQVRFEPVSEEEYLQLERAFDAGRYRFKVEQTTFSIADYAAFIQSDSIAADIDLFEAKQRGGVAAEEARERVLLREWEERKRGQAQEQAPTGETSPGGSVSSGTGRITSPLYGTVWKTLVEVGQVIKSATTVVMILEAMKTEIPVTAGQAAVGRRILRFGDAAQPGKSVGPGDVLIVLE